MLTELDKKILGQRIRSNQHELFVVSMDEMDAIVRSSQEGTKPRVQEAWKKLKGKIEAGASYYASADDVLTLTTLVGDLGGFGAKAYVKTYNGKPHIILKGHPGLRKILTGTRYGVKNPKVVTMGLGKAGAINAARTGGIISVVLLSAYHVIDHFLTDQATLSQLVGTLATDIVKVGITTGASIAAATVMGGFTLAIGPILAVVVVGIGVSMALGALDSHYGITDRIIAGLDELGDDSSSYLQVKKRYLRNSANRSSESVIDYAIDSARRIVVNLASHYLRKLISPSPSVY